MTPEQNVEEEQAGRAVNVGPEQRPATRPMKSLVRAVADACKHWTSVDGLPSPPATAEWLRETDEALARAILALCSSYPKQMAQVHSAIKQSNSDGAEPIIPPTEGDQ